MSRTVSNGDSRANAPAAENNIGMALREENDSDSFDDSSLSSGELDELEYLFQALEVGGDFDAKRLYDLDLVAKSQVGEALDGEQKMDLTIIMRNRRKERAFRKEFQYVEYNYHYRH